MKNKKVAILVVTAAVLFGITTGVFASEAARQITATLDPGVTVTLDGTAQTLKDANGNVVYPIMYNGSTYLPVRPISDLFDVKIGWDQPTKTVILGDSGGTQQPDPTPEPAPSTDEVNLAATMGSGNEYCWRLTDPGDLVVEGQTFSTGIARDIWNSFLSSSKYTLVTHDVKGKNSLTFTAWSDMDANIVILDKDGGTISSFPVDANSFITKTVDISKYDQIAFGADAQNSRDLKGSAKIFDPIVK